MKKFLAFFSLFIVSFSLFAQKHQRNQHKRMSAPVENSGKAVWSKGLQFSLYAGQAGGKNWASGSNIFSLSANSFLSAYANRTRGRWFWNNAGNASYGMIITDEAAALKSDDKIDYFSTLGMDFRKKSKSGKTHKSGLAAGFNFRSQFTNGYDRDYLNQGLKRRTSGFFAPAYITVAPIGYIWHPRHLTFYGSPIGFRGVIVSNQPYSYSFPAGSIPGTYVNAKNPASQERSVAEMYGVDPSKTIRYEIGPYVSVQYDHPLCRNVNLMGRLDAFSDFNHHNAENVQFFLQNSLLFKVNNWLNATYSFDMAYDDNIKKFGYFKSSPELQMKSVLGIGVSLNVKDHVRMHNRRRMGHMDHK